MANISDVIQQFDNEHTFRYKAGYMKYLLLVFSLLFTLSIQAMPSQVFIIRHGEKVVKGGSLSTKGNERAAALVPYLMETPTLFATNPPAAIYAMQTVTGETASPCIETITPLAEKLKITVTDKYNKGEHKKMAEAIKTDPLYNGKIVLICWEHSTIPELTRAFGALQTPARWQDINFDRVWAISFSQTGKATFQDIPQRLMFGDTTR